jgi:hypothetical protein
VKSGCGSARFGNAIQSLCDGDCRVRLLGRLYAVIVKIAQQLNLKLSSVRARTLAFTLDALQGLMGTVRTRHQA